MDSYGLSRVSNSDVLGGVALHHKRVLGGGDVHVALREPNEVHPLDVYTGLMLKPPAYIPINKHGHP